MKKLEANKMDFYHCDLHGSYFPQCGLGLGCPACIAGLSTTFPMTASPFINYVIEYGEKMKTERKYLPTLSDLLDRITIVQQKELKIPEHRDEYTKELEDLMHDLTSTLREDVNFSN